MYWKCLLLTVLGVSYEVSAAAFHQEVCPIDFNQRNYQADLGSGSYLGSFTPSGHL